VYRCRASLSPRLQHAASESLFAHPREWNFNELLDLVGQYHAAQESYEAALKIKPDDLSVQNNLGLSLAFAGNFPRAISILHPIAARPDATPRLRQNLALVYGLMGDMELAASISRRDLDEETIQNNLRFYELLRRYPNPAEAVAERVIK
jgi:Flp pilus assembly protein TadD